MEVKKKEHHCNYRNISHFTSIKRVLEMGLEPETTCSEEGSINPNFSKVNRKKRPNELKLVTRALSHHWGSAYRCLF